MKSFAVSPDWLRNPPFCLLFAGSDPTDFEKLFQQKRQSKRTFKQRLQIEARRIFQQIVVNESQRSNENLRGSISGQISVS